LHVDAVRRFASGLLGEAGPEDHSGHPIAYWEGVSLRAAVDGLPPTDERWDTVIVDEGQDFSGDDWELVKECVHPKGKLRVFADQAQAFWDERGVQEEMSRGFMKYNLKKTLPMPPGDSAFRRMLFRSKRTGLANPSRCLERRGDPDCNQFRRKASQADRKRNQSIAKRRS